jgi:hypothetical protein
VILAVLARRHRPGAGCCHDRAEAQPIRLHRQRRLKRPGFQGGGPSNRLVRSRACRRLTAQNLHESNLSQAAHSKAGGD